MRYPLYVLFIMVLLILSGCSPSSLSKKEVVNNPDIVEKCVISEEISCSDYYVEEGKLFLEFVNLMGKGIVVTDVRSRDKEGDMCVAQIKSTQINNGERLYAFIDMKESGEPCSFGGSGETVSLTLEISYHPEDSIESESRIVQGDLEAIIRPQEEIMPIVPNLPEICEIDGNVICKNFIAFEDSLTILLENQYDEGIVVNSLELRLDNGTSCLKPEIGGNLGTDESFSITLENCNLGAKGDTLNIDAEVIIYRWSSGPSKEDFLNGEIVVKVT